MLISTLKQTNDNYHKVKDKKEAKIINYFYDQFLLHLSPVNNMMITIFMLPNSSLHQAKKISEELATVFRSIDVAIPNVNGWSLYE